MTLNEWKNNVIDYNSGLNEKLQSSSTAKKLYYGFEVIDGKLKGKPNILFIGINPGRGDGDRHYTTKLQSKELSYLDVYDEGYKVDYPNRYHLAEKMIRFFHLMEWSDEKIIELLTNKAVKTNFFHVATNNRNDINKALNTIEKGFHHSYFNKSAEFTMSLIEIIKPKLVILEGKAVFDAIVVGCCEQHKLWNENKFGCYFDKKLNTQFIGFDRTFSNANRDVFVKELKELIDINQIS
ncbi:hypothetical protein [Algibacter lectus]|uniref:hypothetical protein n=1 Tax=Algibacter lectus TaxID=221126 RepID=UPI002495939C|nr:hypothetical protein [Algibacter lectus]